MTWIVAGEGLVLKPAALAVTVKTALLLAETDPVLPEVWVTDVSQLPPFCVVTLNGMAVPLLVDNVMAPVVVLPGATDKLKLLVPPGEPTAVIVPVEAPADAVTVAAVYEAELPVPVIVMVIVWSPPTPWPWQPTARFSVAGVVPETLAWQAPLTSVSH